MFKEIIFKVIVHPMHPKKYFLNILDKFLLQHILIVQLNI